VTASVDFHVAIARASGNPVFAAVLDSLRPVMLRAMDTVARDPRLVQRCQREHEGVLKEIESGDGDRAERAMRDHLAGSGTDA
jgi:GntR family transcriptional repressor for pyruvate dehydrogenase complex